jgi:hypothetical protein
MLILLGFFALQKLDSTTDFLIAQVFSEPLGEVVVVVQVVAVKVVIRIGSNILSQTVQRNLACSTADLGTASERLASGQRINKGSDDAAGLAIATSLRTDSRIFAQALRNLNDGLSFKE